MVDFVAVLEKAVADLGEPTQEERLRFYASARESVLQRLNGLGPSVREDTTLKYMAALEDSIYKVERWYDPQPSIITGQIFTEILTKYIKDKIHHTNLPQQRRFVYDHVRDLLRFQSDSTVYNIMENVILGIEEEHREHEDAEENSSVLAEELLDKLRGVASKIPEQNALMRFGVSPSNKLQLVPSRTDENDYATIDALGQELLAADGPIETLDQRYSQNPNLPQAGLFRPIVEKYREELAKDPKDINYVVLYARGSRFYAARMTSNRQVEVGEWPDPDPKESEAIDALCTLHGNIIMASSVGRRLIADAHDYEATPDVYQKEEVLFQKLGKVLVEETELFETETTEAISDILAPIENDPQPARSRTIRLFLASSVFTAVVGGAAWFTAGGTAVVAGALAVTGLGGMFMWEVAKKMDTFKKASDRLATIADRTVDSVDGKHRLLLERMAEFVEREGPLLRKVANLRPEFEWAKKYLRKSNVTVELEVENIVAGVPKLGTPELQTRRPSDPEETG